MRFSSKQQEVMRWWTKGHEKEHCNAIICDGAVRSGKTLSMSLSFIMWCFSMFSGQDFAFCGKTRGALVRNVIRPLCRWLSKLSVSHQLKEGSGILEIEMFGRKNRFYLFSGKDEASADIIQGATLAGVLFDEVALMPRNFVEQALARCSVEGARFWFNCNPEHPYHWFYREWILGAEERGAFYLHFLMDDNPSLSEAVRRRYETLYSGVRHERFVLGRWCAMEGAVYENFSAESHVVSATKLPQKCEQYVVSCDYGTVNPTSMGLWGKCGAVWYRLKEYYYDSKKSGGARTDTEHYEGLLTLVGDLPVHEIVLDPSAASFGEVVRRGGKFSVVKAKNDVTNGIRMVSDALSSGQIFFSETCEDLLREFSLYRYGDSGETPRKEFDHAMDDLRYFVVTILYAEETSEDDFFFTLALER